MPQYWSIDELHDTARTLWKERTSADGITQQDVTDVINRDRKVHGKDTVTRQAVAKAVKEGGRRYVGLLADVVGALMPTAERIQRADGRPQLFVQVGTDPPDHPDAETETHVIEE